MFNSIPFVLIHVLSIVGSGLTQVVLIDEGKMPTIWVHKGNPVWINCSFDHFPVNRVWLFELVKLESNSFVYKTNSREERKFDDYNVTGYRVDQQKSNFLNARIEEATQDTFGNWECGLWFNPGPNLTKLQRSVQVAEGDGPEYVRSDSVAVSWCHSNSFVLFSLIFFVLINFMET